ncbi:MAG: hypothetical protein HS115_19365 [Spirochaetales bacterium]|nr:hypothetical protein [Spirochaetales bacterium]
MISKNVGKGAALFIFLLTFHCQLVTPPCDLADSLCNPVALSLLYLRPRKVPRLEAIVVGGSSSIDRYNLDGSFHSTLFAGEAPEILSTDQESRQIYWSSAASQYLRRGPFNGIYISQIVSGYDVGGSAADSKNGIFYFTDNGTDQIFSANLDGSAVTLRGSTAGGPQSPFLDGPYLYVARKDDAILSRLHLASGSIEDVTGIAPGAMFMATADPFGDSIYYSIATLAVQRSGKNPPATPTYLVGSGTAFGIAIDPYAGHLYFRDAATVTRCNLQGMECVLIISGGLSGSGLVLLFDST